MKSKSFEGALQRLLNDNHADKNASQQNDVNPVDALQPLTTEGAANDVARSVLREEDDTGNIARAAK